jgi:hypothetical protein
MKDIRIKELKTQLDEAEAKVLELENQLVKERNERESNAVAFRKIL